MDSLRASTLPGLQRDGNDAKRGRGGDGWCDLEALLRAWREARRGKCHRPDVALFERDAERGLVALGERGLVALGERLRARRWRPNPYRVFTVRDPVVRTIAALPFEDRVVQHSLMAVVAPRIVRTLAPQTWTCLPGRGSHGALAWAAPALRGETLVPPARRAEVLPQH